MMKQFVLLVGLGVVAISSAGALDLAGALSAGKVCERPDGYIQATAGNEAETDQLVNSVNTKRTSVYAGIAAERNLPADAIAAEMAREERAANPGKFCR